MSQLVVAVDPGPSYTGVVARKGDELLAWMVAIRSDRHVTEPLIDHAERSLTVVEDVLDRALGSERVTEPGATLYAVEGYNTPTPHAGKVDPVQIAETAWLTGWLYAALRGDTLDDLAIRSHRVVLVPPNKHGRSVLGAYPDELVTDGERRGNWRMRTAGRNTLESHARSAWDVAGAAPAQLRLAEVD